MTPRDVKISTSLEIAIGIHFHEQHGTKTTLVFLIADGEASWSLPPSSVSLLSGGTVHPENTYSCILKVTVQVWESQKRISINTNHSYDQHSTCCVSLNYLTKPDSVLNKTIWKDRVWGYSM